VERAFRRRRRPLAPNCVDELARGGGTLEVRNQISKDSALLCSRKLERTLRPYDLERAEDPELHRRMLRRSGKNTTYA
jgi:hypothetical protein